MMFTWTHKETRNIFNLTPCLVHTETHLVDSNKFICETLTENIGWERIRNFFLIMLS